MVIKKGEEAKLVLVGMGRGAQKIWLCRRRGVTIVRQNRSESGVNCIVLYCIEGVVIAAQCTATQPFQDLLCSPEFRYYQDVNMPIKLGTLVSRNFSYCRMNCILSHIVSYFRYSCISKILLLLVELNFNSYCILCQVLLYLEDSLIVS